MPGTSRRSICAAGRHWCCRGLRRETRDEGPGRRLAASDNRPNRMSVSIAATTPDAQDQPPLLSFGERFSLALRLTLSMIAAGLLGIALIWRALVPGEQGVADLVAGAAAA